jgi:hypothetical protein
MNFSMLFQVPQSNMIRIFKNGSVEFHEWTFQHYVKLLDQTWVVVLEMLVLNLMNEFFNIMSSF